MRSGKLTFSIVLLLFILTALFALPTKDLQVKDLFTRFRNFRSLPLGFQWIPGQDAYSFLSKNQEIGVNELKRFDLKSKMETVLISRAKLIFKNDRNEADTAKISTYQWIPSQEGLVFTYREDIFYFDVKAGKLDRLTQTDPKEENISVSPDSRWISFVRRGDLFAIDMKSGKEKQFTSDGTAEILNGKLDWVYQEELYSRGNYIAYWWSPDSKKICFLHFDQRNVPLYPLVDYSVLHPSVEFMHYPKAGDLNSVVKIAVVDVKSGKRIWLDLGHETDVYFPRTYWLPNSRALAVLRLDRNQQNLDLLFADAETGESQIVFSETDPCWIDITDFVYFFKSKNRFIWSSEKSGYQHLYLYDYQGHLIKQLTKGNWAVTDLNGVNEKKNQVYFTATRKDRRERHLYRLDLKRMKLKRITGEPGIHRGNLSPDAKYYIDSFSTPLLPGRSVLFTSNGKMIKEFKNPIISQLKEYNLVEPEFLQVKGSDGRIFDAQITKPADFNASKKYPVLVYVYGGPHSQLVVKRFAGLWNQLLAQKGFIIFTLDNRGTVNRGREWETAVYRQLGNLELEDQLDGVEFLKTLPWVDSTRIGIWGWSYGGYMVLNALVHSTAFKLGISVAPVSSWRYYDTIYTERYMGLPKDNEAGYFSGSPLNFAENLSGLLFLAHGTGDDNVHVQNTVEFVDRLIDADKRFKLNIYPNQTHSISSTADRIQLYNAMLKFLQDNL